MSTSYTPYYPNGWINEETQTTTPICAEALNNIENGIAANAEAIAELEEGGGGGGGSVTVDTALSPTSTNPVQNKAIYSALGNVESLLASI